MPPRRQRYERYSQLWRFLFAWCGLRGSGEHQALMAGAPASSCYTLEELMTSDILLRNNVKVLGEGTQPMLFAHGFGCDQNMWRLVVPAFLSDYRVVLFDYVGAGKSDWGAYTPERYN